MEKMSLTTRTPLNNGGPIPVLGLGVWQIPSGTPTEQAVLWALEAGYRHIDTATYYRNEESVGAAVRQSGIPREEIFVTTKLWPTDAVDVGAAFNLSLQKLGLDYVDLYLVHWPIPFLENKVWKKMEKLYDQKRARSVGLSNYSVAQLQSVLDCCSTPPSVNQIEFNPFNFDREMLDFCRQTGVVLEAYSPLTRGHELDDEIIGIISLVHKRSPSQIMLRWALQKGAVVIPKSRQKVHIEENAKIFDFSLTDMEMERIDSLSR